MLGKRRWAIALVALLVLVLVAAACGDDKNDDSASATTTKARTTTTASSTSGELRVRAGMNDPEDKNIAVLQFLPAKVTVKTGQKIVWDWSDTIEPHSVTFAADGKLPPPGPPDEKLFAPTPPTGPYAGGALVNSGLQPLGPAPAKDFELSFSKPGTYQYFCVIHPQMTGTITVADSGADTASAVKSRGDDDADQYLAEGRDAKKAFEAKPVRKETNGSATTWFVNMGTSTAHTDVLAFQPVPAEVKAGDTVTFVNDSAAPHTATFGAAPADPTSPQAVNPAPGPSPQTLAASGFFNTGQLPPNSPPGAGPPEAVRSYSYKIPSAGNYPYICILHVASQMTGSIKAT